MKRSMRCAALRSPKLILLLAIVLPGSGHVVLEQVRRALGFLFFMLLLGWITARFAAPDVSFVGRHAGGFFVYAMSILDAYHAAALSRAATAPPSRAATAPSRAAGGT